MAKKSQKPIALTGEERLVLQGLCAPYEVNAVVRNRNCIELTTAKGSLKTLIYGRPLNVEAVSAAMDYLRAEALRKS